MGVPVESRKILRVELAAGSDLSWLVAAVYNPLAKHVNLSN